MHTRPLIAVAFTVCASGAAWSADRPVQADSHDVVAAMLAPAGVGFIDIANVPYTDVNDTSGSSDTVNYVPSFCAARGNVDGPERIYRFVPQAGANVTFTATPQNGEYDVAIYLIDSLKGGKYCLIGADDNGPGQAESFSFSDRFRPGITYYLYVDSFHSAAVSPANAQGPYQLELSGSLPVELLQFGVD